MILTVGQLRFALQGVPDDMGLVLRSKITPAATQEPLCPQCGKPFTSPDFDPHCSSCTESGALLRNPDALLLRNLLSHAQLPDRRAVMAAVERLEKAARCGQWKPMLGPDGLTQCEEGRTYVFAVAQSNREGEWGYFVDALTWDAESEPQWRDGCHGWGEQDGALFLDAPFSAPSGGER